MLKKAEPCKIAKPSGLKKSHPQPLVWFVEFQAASVKPTLLLFQVYGHHGRIKYIEYLEFSCNTSFGKYQTGLLKIIFVICIYYYLQSDFLHPNSQVKS